MGRDENWNKEKTDLKEALMDREKEYLIKLNAEPNDWYTLYLLARNQILSYGNSLKSKKNTLNSHCTANTKFSGIQEIMKRMNMHIPPQKFPRFRV